MPSEAEILAFLEQAGPKAGKREISRAFGIKGAQRPALKALLRAMTEKGALAGNRKHLRQPGRLPNVTVIEVTGRDRDGELVAAPLDWERDDGPPPRIVIVLPRKARGLDFVPGVGDRLLARLRRLSPGEGQASGAEFIDDEDFDTDIADDAGDDTRAESGDSQPENSSTLTDGYDYEARPIKRLARATQRLLGIFRSSHEGGGVIEPVDRRQLRDWPVEAGETAAAGDGDLVRFELVQRGGRSSLHRARISEVLGNPGDQRQISLIAIHAHGLPDEFPPHVLESLDKLKPPTLARREDLRKLPLITIDPPDARDHDDAVWAAPDDDPKNSGGHVLIVAIADVAHYVFPGSSLDQEALKRGNSVYFPDRVVPMLPEKISNDLCSLREGEERPCLAVQMVFDKNGHKISHRFMRAMMRSAAKLSYAQAQAAIDGAPDDATGPLLEPVLKPLWRAYETLARARDNRAPLDLDLPERKIIVGEDGKVARVVVPERLAANRLIEEFMIQANVAAAEMLEAKATPLIYRVHDQPSKEKLTNLKEFLRSLDIAFSITDKITPASFNKILDLTKDGEAADLVNEVVLRAQSQAEYAPGNFGHFGLNLRRYAHFTSPIRRYADLVVHRALVRALQLGEGGLSEEEIAQLDETAAQISQAERRAMAAERETADRLISAFLADRIGATFHARISGVTRSGLFVRLSETGADGFIAISTLGNEYFVHDETHQALIGDRSNLAYRMGDMVDVKLVEAIPSAGALRFEMVTPGRRLPHGAARSRKRPAPHRQRSHRQHR